MPKADTIRSWMSDHFGPVSFSVVKKKKAIAELTYNNEYGYFTIDISISVIERRRIDWQDYCEFSLIGQDKSFPLCSYIPDPNTQNLYMLSFEVLEYADSKKLRDSSNDFGNIKVDRKGWWIKSPNIAIEHFLTTGEIEYDEWNEKRLKNAQS